MRVLISAGWLGGAGGAERALHSVIRALGEDDVDVVVREHLGGTLAQIGPRARVIPMSDPRFRAAAMTSGFKGLLVQKLINPLRRRLLGNYDVYLQFHAGPSLGSAVNARVRLLVPSGNHIDSDRAKGFDFVALQAPDNATFVAPGVHTVLLPPPLYELSERRERPDIDLPEAFYLTVFNPYGAVKGTDDLERAADEAPLPIVWCHSQLTVTFDIPHELVDHPNVVHVTDATPSQLRYLYEKCLAYLSFSKSEGFGWSTADALRYSTAVVSRDVGILTYHESEQEEAIRVGEEWKVDWSTLPRSTRTVARDLNWVSPGAFRGRLAGLLN